MVYFSKINIKYYKRIVVTSLLLSMLFSIAINVVINKNSTAITSSAKVVNNMSHSSSEIVMEASTLRVLSGKNIYEKLPMASTTKAMTAYVVIKNNQNLDKVITIPKESVGIEGSSIYLIEGEKLSIRELLYGLMLRSGNDSATALAIATSGSIEKFVELMNITAMELGMDNTNFTNPHGLHDEMHYTCAYDLAKLSSLAMSNNTFKQIVSTKNITIPYNNDSVRYLGNKNKILSNIAGGNGIKTGYTKAAGRCLISSAIRNDMQLVGVVLNYGDMFGASINMLNNAFDTYNMYDITSSDKIPKTIQVIKGKENIAQLYMKSYAYPLTLQEFERLEYSISLPENIKAPINKEEIIGKLSISLDNNTIFYDNIVTNNSIKKKGLIFGN